MDREFGFGCVMNSEKLIMDKENQNKTNSREGVCKLFYQHYWFVKTMKGGKSGSGKYYYSLLPNNRSIQVGAQYSTTCGK